MEDTTTRLARVAKGKAPVYLDERAIDNLYTIVITMAQENAVLRDRLDTVERLLDEQGTLARQSIEDYVPDTEAAAERDARNAAYIAKILRCLKGEREALDQEAAQ